ncbi:hypothetical protein ACISU4_25265, partial [Streptomyces wuyuanensis]|uniref:hypothetical protein n=1 Tax=Streptomyces wuyuanensis TaxID=1196353 RepID=UPI003806E223
RKVPKRGNRMIESLLANHEKLLKLTPDMLGSTPTSPKAAPAIRAPERFHARVGAFINPPWRSEHVV